MSCSTCQTDNEEEFTHCDHCDESMLCHACLMYCDQCSGIICVACSLEPCQGEGKGQDEGEDEEEDDDEDLMDI